MASSAKFQPEFEGVVIELSTLWCRRGKGVVRGVVVERGGWRWCWWCICRAWLYGTVCGERIRGPGKDGKGLELYKVYGKVR